MNFLGSLLGPFSNSHSVRSVLVPDRTYDLKHLEDLKFAQLQVDKRKGFDDRVLAIRQQFYNRQAEGTHVVNQLIEASQEHIKTQVEGWLSIRRELALQAPELVSDPELEQLQLQLERLVSFNQRFRPRWVQGFAEEFGCSPTFVAAAIHTSTNKDNISS